MALAKWLIQTFVSSLWWGHFHVGVLLPCPQFGRGCFSLTSFLWHSLPSRLHEFGVSSRGPTVTSLVGPSGCYYLTFMGKKEPALVFLLAFGFYFCRSSVCWKQLPCFEGNTSYVSKLSLISQALYLCHRARSCLDDLPSKADESFQFEQHLRDVSAYLLKPSASAVVNITVIYPWPLTARNLCAPYSCMVFAGHHAANEVTRKEDGVVIAENVLRVRLITARGICMYQTCKCDRWKRVSPSYCDSGEDTTGGRLWGDGQLVNSGLSQHRWLLSLPAFLVPWRKGLLRSTWAEKYSRRGPRGHGSCEGLYQERF